MPAENTRSHPEDAAPRCARCGHEEAGARSDRPAGTTRRRALAGAGAAAGAAVLLAACGDGKDSATDAETIAEPLDLAGTDEVPEGGSVQKAKDGTTVLLTQPSKGEFKAFSTVCPHQGCTVNADGAQLTCPCHHSVFSIEDGSVQAGPAQKPLPEFTAQVKNGRIIVSS
ncbi:Rieske (2Fe-2S) protein [Rothia kristinae]|uniref:Cytochrome bc1 complex Rieske iron-sulfur subunit n=1 Tax=Rothia kristinae TaxID=37923 RepID=A0A7T3CFN0_9MICC|nr:Rieske (2Fe-2S) protein [Rothia kristinae]QPT53288.1 Rieske (2Fe-2S) protein [Rothia kristinae]